MKIVVIVEDTVHEMYSVKWKILLLMPKDISKQGQFSLFIDVFMIQEIKRCTSKIE